MAKLIIIRITLYIFFFLLVVNYFNYFIIYFRLLNCAWPKLSSDEEGDPLRVMFITDVHLKTDTLWNITENVLREWQMYWTYNLAKNIFKPQVIIILGDLFDDGINYNEQEFNTLVKKFETIFSFKNIPKGIKSLKATEEEIIYFTIHGNHDIGFHWEMSPYLKNRFERTYNLEDIQQFEINGIRFVSVNSVTMEGDSCQLCLRAVKQLHEVARQLCPPEDIQQKCLDINRPILLTHYPLYRESEELCGNDWDTRAERITYDKFIETNDCISRNATQLILNTIRPRLVFSGHTHFTCITRHMGNAIEWTIASFNYRYLSTPTFVLAKFTPNQNALNKCILTHELTFIFWDFLLILFFVFLWIKRVPQNLFNKFIVISFEFINDKFGYEISKSFEKIIIRRFRTNRNFC